MLFGSSNPYLTDLNKGGLLSLVTDIDVREFSELHQCACLKSVENIHEKYIKPAGCYYQKFKNGDTVSNSWADELADPNSLDDFDKADAEFIVNQLTLHEIKKHVVSAFIDGDVDADAMDWSGGLVASGRMTNDFKRDSTKSSTSNWNWRVGTQYDRDGEGRFKCVDPNKADETFGDANGGYSVSCISEWETYQFEYIQKLLDEARDGSIDGTSDDTWLKFELPLSYCPNDEDPCTYEDYIKASFDNAIGKENIDY